MSVLPEKPAPAAASELMDDVTEVVRLHVQLAKQEVREIAVSNLVAGAAFGAAVILAAIAILAGVPVLLVVILPWHWEVAAIWIVALLVLAGAGFLVGKAKLRVEPPKKTIETLKEDREWALRQIRSERS